jgi:hypothetical protein
MSALTGLRINSTSLIHRKLQIVCLKTNLSIMISGRVYDTLRDICLGYQEQVLRSGGGTALLRNG